MDAAPNERYSDRLPAVDVDIGINITTLPHPEKIQGCTLDSRYRCTRRQRGWSGPALAEVPVACTASATATLAHISSCTTSSSSAASSSSTTSVVEPCPAAPSPLGADVPLGPFGMSSMLKFPRRILSIISSSGDRFTLISLGYLRTSRSNNFANFWDEVPCFSMSESIFFPFSFTFLYTSVRVLVRRGMASASSTHSHAAACAASQTRHPPILDIVT
mmetsp:Transcript_21141/g.55007  ORF Transcript_21141/g.55007 Transcript_21141/m.55007 type:complete len:218 (+) Transcript_21141:804-1457(+)